MAEKGGEVEKTESDFSPSFHSFGCTFGSVPHLGRAYRLNGRKKRKTDPQKKPLIFCGFLRHFATTSSRVAVWLPAAIWLHLAVLLHCHHLILLACLSRNEQAPDIQSSAVFPAIDTYE
jgi:hypothetical protein